MNITEIIPNVLYDNGAYKFKNIFYKYILESPIDEEYLQKYTVIDGEFLEDVSYKIYGDPIYYWVIMIINSMNDPIFDMPLSENTIQEMARDYATVNGEVDMVEYLEKYDELTIENDNKREIKVVKREYLNKVLSQMVKEFENIEDSE